MSCYREMSGSTTPVTMQGPDTVLSMVLGVRLNLSTLQLLELRMIVFPAAMTYGLIVVRLRQGPTVLLRQKPMQFVRMVCTRLVLLTVISVGVLL